MRTRKFIDYIAIFILFASMALSFCALPVVINNNKITFALIFEMIFCAGLLLINYKKFFSLVKKFFSYKEVQMVILYLFTVIALGFVVMFQGGDAGIVKILLTSIFRIIRIIFPFFFGYYFICKLKNHNTINILMVILLIILCYAVVDLFIFSFNISALKPIHGFFLNSHLGLVEDYKTGAIPRIQSFFGEPSFFANFIVLFLPLLYTAYFTKIKFFKKKCLNISMKKILLPFAIIILLLTQSPIYIIAGIVVLCFCYFSTLNMKNLIYVSLSFLLFVLIISFNISLIEENLSSNRVVERIISTITSFGSMETLVASEASLGTRVVSYLNMFDIYKENPFLGCGCGNLQDAVYRQFTLSDYPLTEEIKKCLLLSKPVINANIFFQTIAESGFIAVIFLYVSFMFIILRINNTMKNAIGKDLQVLYAFRMYMCVFVLLSFYDSNIYLPYIWVMFGIIIGYCVNVKQKCFNIKRIPSEQVDSQNLKRL